MARVNPKWHWWLHKLENDSFGFPKLENDLHKLLIISQAKTETITQSTSSRHFAWPLEIHHENFIWRYPCFNDPGWSGWEVLDFLLKGAMPHWCCNWNWLMCPNVGRSYDYVSKLYIQISSQCSTSDMFGPTQVRKKTLAYWAVNVRPAHSGKDIWQNAWQQTNSGEFSWVKLTVHSLIGNWTLLFSCFWSFNIQIPRLFGDVDHLVGWLSVILFTRKPSQSSNTSDKSSLSPCLDPSSSNSQSFKHKAHNLDKVW